jgi:hypothetical protein
MAQTLGLPVSRLIDVTVNLAPSPTPFANFDTLLVVGDSNIINVDERIRSYDSLLSVAGDFGTNAPEYLSAELFFAQVPQPQQLFIGRWAQSATAGINIGGPLTAAEEVQANWTAITAGSFHVVVGGVGNDFIGMDFSGTMNLNGVAFVISTAMTGIATCTWNGSQFIIQSVATGLSATVSYLTPVAPPTGTDISAMLRMDSATAETLVAGIAAETALQAVILLDGVRTFWYFMTFASSHITDNDHASIAAYIEAAANPHMYGITTAEAAALTTTDSTSIGHLFKVAGYRRTAVQYSSTNLYAITSMFARGCTVDFEGSNSAITFMWKQEPLVSPEFLGATQADALDSNNYNYLAEFNVDVAIIVNGKTASGFFVDEIWGTDWFANNIQINLFNLLLDATKIPQTDPGVQLLVNTTEASCVQAVTNGLLAPGVWQSGGFGALNQNDQLPKGFYVFAPPVATQSPADRAARKSPLIQVAAKLAGAIHTVDVLVNVNR